MNTGFSCAFRGVAPHNQPFTSVAHAMLGAVYGDIGISDGVRP
ncbi:MAG: hypothetical protein PVG42_07755 [Lysobacterales bacterium]